MKWCRVALYCPRSMECDEATASARSAAPSGGDVSTDCGASDEGDDGDDPELPLRGTKVFDHRLRIAWLVTRAADDR